MNGVILIDKPAGLTSFDVVARLRRLAHERRAGHAGTLDPMATGVLSVFLGEATKAIPLLTCHDKRYTAGLRLGVTTDTGDVTGKELSRSPVTCSDGEVEDAALAFKGKIMQVPPMYSALKSGGRHLYDIAREGGVVEREARPVTVYDIALTGKNGGGDYTLDVRCSKGTYIRTLCEDIGARLGCGGTMASLRRTFASGFELGRCHTLEEAQKLAEEDKLSNIILDVEEIFTELPAVAVSVNQAVRFRNGGALSFDRLEGAPQSGLCRLRCGCLFIGLGEAEAEKRQIKVRCHFNREAAIGGEVH